MVALFLYWLRIIFMAEPPTSYSGSLFWSVLSPVVSAPTHISSVVSTIGVKESFSTQHGSIQYQRLMKGSSLSILIMFLSVYRMGTITCRISSFTRCNGHINPGSFIMHDICGISMYQLSGLTLYANCKLDHMSSAVSAKLSRRHDA